MTLAFTVTEPNDNKSIVIKDTTLDWGGGQIQAVFTSGSATITLTILGVTYDAIPVKSYFNGGLQSNLSFVITPALLKISGVVQYHTPTTDQMPDGDYNIIYYANTGAINDTETQDKLIFGIIEHDVLDIIRITNINVLSFDENTIKAMLRLAHYSYLMGMINSAYESQVGNLRTALANLRIMVDNQIY
jgi:hypothetical protein